MGLSKVYTNNSNGDIRIVMSSYLGLCFLDPKKLERLHQTGGIEFYRVL